MLWAILACLLVILAVNSRPLPAAAVPDHQKATAAELRFASHHLQLAGLVLLSVGVLGSLKTSGLAASGWPQCLSGAAVGLFLSFLGEQVCRRQQLQYGVPLLAAGQGLLVVVLTTAHFLFDLIGPLPLAAGLFVLVLYCGLSALRWNSPVLAGILLLALFLAPALMNFSLSHQGTVLVYLLTINVATTAVAYRRRWDAFLVATFTATHWLYSTLFPLSLPFLCTTYGLFLVAANAFPLGQGRPSRSSHLWLAMCNPLVFACLSYGALVSGPNGLALALYGTISLIHFGIAWLARKRDLAVAQTNLSLGMLFGLATISFLTYCQADTSWFGTVTLLWLACGTVWRGLGHRLAAPFAPLWRRGGYLATSLAALQLAYVVPTMEAPLPVQLASLLLTAIMFVQPDPETQNSEERYFANLLALQFLGLLTQMLPFTRHGLPLLGALAPLMLTVYYRYPRTLPWLHHTAFALAALVTLVALQLPWCPTFGALLLPLLALLLATITPLARRHGDTAKLAPAGVALSVALLMRAALVLLPPTPATLFWCLLGAALLRCAWLHEVAGVTLSAAFVKTVAYDADLAAVNGLEWVLSLAVAVAFGWCSRLSRQPWSNVFGLYALLTLVFQISRALSAVYGTLDNYQVILSGFWSAASLLFIAAGTYRENRLCRCFGLTLLVACVSKMYAVDIWVLNSYDQSTTTVLMGMLLLLVSFVYQLNRDRLHAPVAAVDEPDVEKMIA